MQARNGNFIPQNVGPHSFRKIYAVDLMEKYGDIERVQRALNHLLTFLAARDMLEKISREGGSPRDSAKQVFWRASL